MTPFGIRKRIRALVSRVRPGPVEDETFEVEFVLPDGTTHRVRTEAHYTLTMASQLLDTPIDAPCPDGRCGLCQVTVLADGGGLAPPAKAEAEILEKVLGPNPDPAIRLACHARLQGPGVRIQVQKVWDLESVRGR